MENREIRGGSSERVKERTESNKSFSSETYNSWVCGRRSDSYKIETFRNVL